jgi:hypothetical protein
MRVISKQRSQTRLFFDPPSISGISNMEQSTFEMVEPSGKKTVVVGAGPVGSLAALYAATRGDEVEVYELRGGMFDSCWNLCVMCVFMFMICTLSIAT